MNGDQATKGRVAFDDHVYSALKHLSPAEQRTARFFIDQKEVVLLGSAAEIGEKAGASDATVIRTARSLGFEGLAPLREVLLAELSAAPSPGRRLERTLDETGNDAIQALKHVIGLHEDVLAVLKHDDVAEAFSHALEILAEANRRHVFGIGPSGALAEYAALQFNRIGFATSALSVAGVALADRLLWLAEGDAILMIAYAPLYREVTAVLEQAEQVGVPIVLISDSLGPLIKDRIAAVLSVPRGRAGHLAMHGGTMVLIEAVIIALAARHRKRALDSLDRFNGIRGAIDKAWLKRGVRRSKKPKNKL